MEWNGLLIPYEAVKNAYCNIRTSNRVLARRNLKDGGLSING